MHTNVHCGTVYNSQDMEATEMSIGHTMDDYSAMKKNEIMSFAAMWMDLESVIMSEVSQTEKEKYHMASLICGI